MSQAAPALLAPDSTPAQDASSPQACAIVRHLTHELRQPLSTIESIAYYLEMVLPRHDPKVRQQVEKLQQLVHQVNWILSDAVHFLQAAVPKPQVLDLYEVITESVADYSAEDEVGLRMELEGPQALVEIDPSQAQHLVRSVLSFCRQMKGAGGELILRSMAGGNEWLIRIDVPGVELDPAELGALLDPFHSRLPAGFGLALASARRIVEVHHGWIRLASEAGQGTSVFVGLPCAG